jgi:TolB-like protein
MLQFGSISFDPATGRLSRDGAPIRLGGRALAVLTALAASEEAVSKEALLDAAWPGVTVEEGNLTVQVAALRKLLGDDAILTVPRVGYRLRRPSPLPAAAGLPRLAVLPFEVLGNVAQDGYLADGIAEDVVTALGRFREFSVLTRQAALAQQDRLAAAGVRYVLRGTLRRAGDRLRVTAHMADTGSGAQLWARSFDGVYADLFDMQDLITEAVVGAVAPEVQAAEFRAVRTRPASTEAYDHYLRALAEHEKTSDEGSRKAVALLDRAIAAEPDNPVYLAAQAWVLPFRPMSGWEPITADDQAACRDLALRALGIGTDDPRSLSYCANALLHCSQETDLALASSRRALEANPNMMIVVLIAADPMHYITRTLRAHVALVSGRSDEALQLAIEALPLNLFYAPTHWMLTAANALTGRMEAARLACARLEAAVPGTTVAGIRQGQPKALPDRIEPVLRGLKLAGLPVER